MSKQLSGKFTLDALAKFSWPTIVMLLFMAMYSMVDGAFVARLIGTHALSAVNIVFPLVGIYFSVGIMLGTGGSALVAMLLGEGRSMEARQNYSLIALAAAVIGIAMAVVGLRYVDDIVRLLGADASLFELCRDYAGTLMWFIPMAVMQALFQSFFVAAGRPGFGLGVVVAGGLVNILLDYIFIAVMEWGIAGAALATGIGYCVPALVGLWFFLGQRGGSLRFARPGFSGSVLLEATVNGSSEMVTNLAFSVVTFLFNREMMRQVGVDGVAAITIVLYVEFLLSAIYFGYSSGVAPLFSYQYGKGDTAKLKLLFRNSVLIMAACSVAAVAVGQSMAGTLVAIFAPRDSVVYDIALHGFRLFSLAYLIMGFNIFASALFTALSNGKISAFLSFMRIFVFISLGILTLPMFLGVNGVWLAVPVAEVLTLILSILCLCRYRRVYQFA